LLLPPPSTKRKALVARACEKRAPWPQVVKWCRFGPERDLTPEAPDDCAGGWSKRDVAADLTPCLTPPLNRIVPATAASPTAITCMAPPLPKADVRSSQT